MMNARFKKSLADVTRRKGRTLLVVLGICIGVFGLTAINTAEDHLLAAYAFSVGSQATQPDLVIDVDRLDPALQPQLAAVANVKTVQLSTTVQTQWHVTQAPGHVDMTIVSYPDLQHATLMPFDLLSGRYPAAGEIVMEYGDLATQSFSLGDTITVDTAQGTARLRIVGMARTAGVNTATTDTVRGYMSDASIQALPAYTNVATAPPLGALRLEHIAVKVQSIAQVNATATALGTLLRDHHIAVLGVGFPEPLVTSLQHLTGIFTLLQIVAFLAIALSGILILNTVTALVTEQIAIIGTMKALGGSRHSIIGGYLVTIAFISMIATVPGILLGLFCGYQLAATLAAASPLAPGPFTFSPGLIALSGAVGLGIPLLAAWVPIWNGTRITVREAISAYGVSVGRGRSVLARCGTRLTWVSQIVWLG